LKNIRNIIKEGALKNPKALKMDPETDKQMKEKKNPAPKRNLALKLKRRRK
jgi:hypothetical protein